MRTEIVSFNPINDHTSTLKTSIYIKPTLEILSFFNRAPMHRGVVKIRNTGSCYDNRNMFCTIDKSSDVPNTRDNFFNSTGLYVITLNTQWFGYPLKNGEVEFMEGIVDDIIDYVSAKKIEKEETKDKDKNDKDTKDKDTKENSENLKYENYESDPNERGLNTNTLLITAAALSIILGFSFYMKK
jgi:hypothetical protein